MAFLLILFYIVLLFHFCFLWCVLENQFVPCNSSKRAECVQMFFLKDTLVPSNVAMQVERCPYSVRGNICCTCTQRYDNYVTTIYGCQTLVRRVGHESCKQDARCWSTRASCVPDYTKILAMYRESLTDKGTRPLSITHFRRMWKRDFRRVFIPNVV